MSDDQISLTPEWSLSVTQIDVAEYLAAGYSQNRTSQICPAASLRTIQRWWTEPEFRDYVMWRRRVLMSEQRPLFSLSVALAQDIVFRAMSGEYDANAPEVRLAQSLLQSTLWRHAKPGGARPGELARPGPGPGTQPRQCGTGDEPPVS